MEDREVKEMHHLLTTTLDCSKSRLRLNVLTWFPEQATTLTKHWKAHYFVHQPCHMGMACSRVKQANTKIVFPPHHSTIGGIFSLALSSKNNAKLRSGESSEQAAILGLDFHLYKSFEKGRWNVLCNGWSSHWPPDCGVFWLIFDVLAASHHLANIERMIVVYRI